MAIQAVVFDAYGTLFDVYSIGALAERLYPGQGATISTLWRDKQIEYTRLISLSDAHEEALMAQYAQLKAFPENHGVLQTLRERGMTTAILSNGNPEMLASAVQSAGMADLLDHLISVDGVRQFKTMPVAYGEVARHIVAERADVLFVSSNAWDVLGATWFGFTTLWINRQSLPFETIGRRPDHTGSDLCAVLDVLGPVA